MNEKTADKLSNSESDQPGFDENTLIENSDKSLQKEVVSRIHIEEMKSCSRVENKQYMGAKTQFSLSKDTTPFVWMKVFSKNPPGILKHVYYLNEDKYCEVPLNIRYHRMRTWSNITLRSKDQIGNWRVEVIDENDVKLDQLQFTVVK